VTFFERNFGGSRPDGSRALSTNSEAVHSHFFGQSSFATHALATENSVVKVPEDAPLELLGPLGCGVQTGAGAVLNSLRPEPGSSIAVFGTGAVGMSAIMAAVVAGCTTIIGIDVKSNRLALCERELGATHTINSAEQDAAEEIRKITSGGVGYSLDTTGVPGVFRQAVESLAPLGTCGIVGAPPIGTEAALDMNNIMIPGRIIRGIIEGDSVPDVFIPRLVDLHERRRFPFDRLIRFYDLDEINKAAEEAEEGSTLKPVLRVR
jgi:aryl-alcohol dehydrogenase